MRASGFSGAETADGTGLLGHRRQHSSLPAGHLEQHQEEQQSRRAAIIARVYNKRKAIEQPYDESARPPKFADRSAFIKSNVTLTSEDVRMIIFSPEKVVFDSKGVVLYKPGDEILPGARLSPCEGFQLTKKSKDANRMNSMIFSTVPSAKNSDTFRIHVLEDCELFVISKTFCFPKKEDPPSRRGNASKRPASNRDHDLAPPPPPSISRLLEASDPESQNTIKSLDGWTPRTSNSIMSTPEGFSRVRHVSLNIQDGEEEVGSAGSSTSLPRAFSPPHRLSSYRRRQMAVTTSLSETSAVAVPSNPKSRSRMSSMSSTVADDDTRPFSNRQLRHVALGIIVPFAQRPFMLQHIPLIEAEMTRLEERIVNAYADTKTFLKSLHALHMELSTIVCELHNAPRLELPYWLALNEKCALDEKTLAVEFCEHLSYLVRRYDRKEAGYFLSNLFSALLMHHLSWVASVAAPPLAASLDPRMRNTLFGPTEDGTPTVGYNALMAQYLEISGACGNVRSAKICILGDDAEIMASMISVISFFIRCSAVKHVAPDTNRTMFELPAEQPFSPMEVSGSPNSASASRAGCSHLHPRPPRQRNEASTSSNPGPSTPSSSSSIPLFSMPGPSTSSQPSTSTFFLPPMPSTSQPSTSAIPQPSVILDRMEEGASSSKAMMTRLRENAQKKKLEAAAAAGAPGPSTSSTRDSDAPVPRDIPSTSTAPPLQSDSPKDFSIISETADMWTSRPKHEKSLGRSMFAGPLDNFCTHFVLSAVKKSEANMTEVYSRMFDEVRCNDNSPAHRSSTTSTAIHHQSVSSQSTSSMGDPVVPENFLIVADIDARTVKVLSSEGSDEVTSPSESVVGLLEQFVGIHEGMTSTAEFLVGMLEDNLAQIVGTSSTLVELVRGLDQAPLQRAPVRPAAAAPAPGPAKTPKTPSTSTSAPTTVHTPHLSPDRVRSIIGCDHSDLRLMINVAGVYWPPVVQSVLG